MQTVALVVAAGRGRRAGGDLPKQYAELSGETVLGRTLRLLAANSSIEKIVTVIHPDDAEAYRLSASHIDKCLDPVMGGDTRQQSVFAGLQSIESFSPETVVIHDAVRPMFHGSLVDRGLKAAKATGAAVPVVPLSDTIKRIGGNGQIIDTLDRSELRAIQTPQIFNFSKLIDAHRRASKAGRHEFTDDAAIAEWAGIPVATFPGEARNLKLTTPDDFLLARALLGAEMETRNGTGFDVHAFGPGDHVTLGGVKIPHARSLVGHSDADVLLHALTDSVLGALGEADIGRHFPPSDAKWRGVSSDRFLAHAISLLKDRRGTIVNLDSTILCELPKIGPYRDAMRASIAKTAGVEIGRVGLKATTMEGLGFIGRGEGIAAMATATIKLPADSK